MPTNGLFAPGEVLTAGNTNNLLTRGYSNRIINGAFVINQRGYTSGTNLASGAYGFDRWKSGFTNTSLTFTAGSQSTLVTISTSGVLQQIVERENMAAGTYTLSWTGTATGRVYNVGGTPPAYGASPQIVTLDGLANVVVEFTAAGGTRTLGTVQLEAGNVFSPFEYRHRSEELNLCLRYFWRNELTTANARIGVGMVSGSGCQAYMIHPVVMRAAPTAITTSGVAANYGFFNGGSALNGATVPTFDAASVFGTNIAMTLTTTLATNGGQMFRSGSPCFIEVSAEL
jgi:hypothetical protein